MRINFNPDMDNDYIPSKAWNEITSYTAGRGYRRE